LGLLDGLERVLWYLEVFLGENMLKNGFLTQKIPSPCFSNHRSGGENLGCNPVDDELFVTFFLKKK
jgi:hypothetical protein